MTTLPEVEAKAQYNLDPAIDMDLIMKIEKSRTLREQRDQIEARLGKVNAEILSFATEAEADFLTIDGVPVARREEFEQARLQSAAVKVSHPRIWKRFTKVSTTVRLVVLN